MKAMNDEVKFNSQICTTKEQSQHLLDLGLNHETADMSYYVLDSEPILTIGMAQVYRETLKGGKIVETRNAEIIPAWSLHRLKCLLPTKIPYESGYLTTEIINNVNLMFITDTSEQRVISFIHENLYESMIKCIKWLIKEDYFNKEYL